MTTEAAPATTPADPSHPDHPHHSIWAAVKAAVAHFIKQIPHAAPYAEEAIKIGIAAGVHVSPQVAIGVGIVEAIAASHAKKEETPATSEPTPTEPAPPAEPTPAE